MDLGSIFILFALVLVTILYITWPLFEKVLINPPSQITTDLASLESDRESILASLQELDDNYAEDKIEDTDFQLMREALLTRGSDVLLRIEALRQPEIDLPDDQAIPAPAPSDGDLMNDPIEAKIGERRRVRKERGAGFCPKCGSPLQKSDRFCWKCGLKTGFDRTA